MFEDYTREHVVSWFAWSRKVGLGVERIEDLILVSGCTLASSWATVAFVDAAQEAEIDLAVRALPNGGASFDWRPMDCTVEDHDSQPDPVRTVEYHNSQPNPVRPPG